MSVLDWTSNFAYAPVLSSRWCAIAPNLRVHSSYNTLVESDLTHYHEAIMTELEKIKNIGDIIFTGHSLGGGLASVAHIIVKSQLEQEGTAWKTSFPRNLTCHTLAFAAPMTTLYTESKQKGIFDAKTPPNIFLKKISDNTCNFVYMFDPVPHAVGDLHYLKEIFISIFPDLKRNIAGNVGAPFLFFVKADGKINILVNQLFSVSDYQHIGKIIHYDKKSKHQILRDSSLVDESLDQFRNNNTIQSPPKKIDDMVDSHFFFPRSFSSAYRCRNGCIKYLWN